MKPCANRLCRAAASVDVMGRALCSSCARVLKLGVPAVPRRIEDELFEHVVKAFEVSR